MKATIENTDLIVRIPLKDAPTPSASGKTLIVASTHGSHKTDAAVEGRPVTISLNAWIPRPDNEDAT